MTRPLFQPDAGLILDSRRGPPRDWFRVTLERTAGGPSLTFEGDGFAYAVSPTVSVLKRLTAKLETVTVADVVSGRAVIGPVGMRVLASRTGAARVAA